MSGTPSRNARLRRALAAVALATPSLMLAREPVAGSPTVVPSVCRGIAAVAYDPDPVRTCDQAQIEIGFRPTCADQPVRMVYITNVTQDLHGSRLYYFFWTFDETLRMMNFRANPNIRVAMVSVGADDATVLTDGFTNDLSLASRALRDTQHASVYGCRQCALEKALELLHSERAALAPDLVAEFIVFYGYLGSFGEGQRLLDLAREIHDEGVVFICPNRELATSDAYWLGGPVSSTLIFRNIGVDFSGTALRSMTVGLDLPSGLAYVPDSARPPPDIEDVLDWDLSDQLPEQVTFTLRVDVGEVLTDTVHLHGVLADWRGRQRELAMPVGPAPPVVDGCHRPTPEPGEASPTPTATATQQVPRPTATATRRRPMAAFLPFAEREPCVRSARPADVVLVIDTSSSMRSADHDDVRAAALAGESFVEVLANTDIELPPGSRRVGIVRFDASAEVLLPLTADQDTIRRSLEELASSDVHAGTRIDTGLAAALDHIREAGRPGVAHAIVLLTDGTQVQEREQVLDEALRARSESVEVYAIGLGTLYDGMLLEQIAGAPERFASASEPDDLDRIFREIAHSVRCGG